MDIVAIIIAALLLCVALRHIWRGMGSPRPDFSKWSLISMRNALSARRRLAAFALAFGFVAAAACALALRGFLPFQGPKLILLLVGGVLAYAFVLRGALGVLPQVDKKGPERPVVAANRLIYASGSLLLGYAFALLVAAWPNWSWRMSLLFD